MNSKQRARNRITALRLELANKYRSNAAHICENCGEPGGHWHAVPQSLEDIVLGRPQQGVYSCQPKL